LWSQQVLIQGAELSELVSETEHWGPGYKQWDMGLTLRANIKRVYGTPDYFDVIMTCGGAGKYPSEFRKSRTVVTTRKHECREGEVCAKPLLEGANDIVAMVNPFEIATNKQLHPLSRQMLLAHMPSPTLEKLFFAKYDHAAQYDVVLMGKVDRLYPLRCTWKKMLDNKATLGLQDIKVGKKPHPQHFVKMDHSKQVKDYAKMMQSTKILLTDTAKVHYSVQKYTEGLVAGALLIGDVPHDRMREYRRVIVEVPTSASPAALAKVVKRWLRPSLKEARLTKARAGQEWALLNYGRSGTFFRDWTELYQEVIGPPSNPHVAQGIVGKEFLYSFYIRCRASGGQPWCEGESRRQRSGTKLPHYLPDKAKIPESMRHPSFGGEVDPADTLVPTDRSCNDIQPPSYMSRWQKLRWLLLLSKTDAEQTFDFSVSYLEEAAREYPHADIVRWGPGVQGYNSAISLQSNILERFGSAEHFDIIFFSVHSTVTVTPAELRAYGNSRTVVIISRFDCPPVKRIDNCFFHNCRYETCAESLAEYKPDIVALGNPHEVVHNGDLHTLSTNALIVHVPSWGSGQSQGHAAPDASTDRPIDVLVLRRRGDSLPDVRGASFDRVLGRQIIIKNFELWRDQDSRLPATGEHSLAASASVELTELLWRSKLVVTDSTTRRYWTEEMTQALLGGALVRISRTRL
jgi:hypothetical protein